MSNPAPTSFYSNTITSGLQAVYLGPFAAAPTTDNFGNPLVVGQLYFNTTTNNLWVWNGSTWLLSTAGAIANPSGTIGLVAVNGSTGFAMDAGSAPPLSQAIAPTWTAAHKWTGVTPQVTLGAAGLNSGSLALLGATAGTSSLTVNTNGALTIGSANAITALSGSGGTSGTLQLLGSTSGSVQLTTPATGGALSVNSTTNVTGSITATTTAILGANGGTGGALTLNGATSGSGTLSVSATGSLSLSGVVTIPAGPLSIGSAGAATGILTLNGTTSGSISVTTPATGGVLSVGGFLATNSGGFQSISGTATVTSGLVLLTAVGGGTLTLPSAANKGQEIKLKATVATTTAYNSASSNVVPLKSSTAGTALYPIGASFVHLVADGTNWQVVAQV